MSEHNPGEPDFGHDDEAPHNPGEPTFADDDTSATAADAARDIEEDPSHNPPEDLDRLRGA